MFSGKVRVRRRITHTCSLSRTPKAPIQIRVTTDCSTIMLAFNDVGDRKRQSGEPLKGFGAWHWRIGVVSVVRILTLGARLNHRCALSQPVAGYVSLVVHLHPAACDVPPSARKR